MPKTKKKSAETKRRQARLSVQQKRKTENENDKQVRLCKHRVQVRKHRSEETDEQKKQRLQSVLGRAHRQLACESKEKKIARLERQNEKLLKENPDDKEKRLEKCRQRAQECRIRETPKAKKKRIDMCGKRMHAYLKSETKEAKNKRLKKALSNTKARLEMENSEENVKRLKKALTCTKARRQSENSEDKGKRLKKALAYTKGRLESETSEEKGKRLKKALTCTKRRLETENGEEKGKRLKKALTYIKAKRESENSEEKGKRLKKALVSTKRRLETETREEKEKRLKKALVCTKRRLETETREEKEKRLKKALVCTKRRLETETSEEKAKRLKKALTCTKRRLETETSEEKGKRLKKALTCTKRRLETENSEEKGKRLKKALTYTKAKRESENSDEKAKRLKKALAYTKRRLESETSEEKGKRLKKTLVCTKRRLESETSEEKGKRLKKTLACTKRRLVNENSEDKTKRLKKALVYEKRRLQSENSEEKRKRLDKVRKRLYQLQTSETPKECKQRKQTYNKCKNARRLIRRKAPQTINEVTIRFWEALKDTPVFVCTSCHRLQWCKSVREMKYSNYDKQPQVQQRVLDIKYRKIHSDGKVYICMTCHNAIKANRIPVQAQANNMELDDIPPELMDLTELEVRIIAQRILFMQLKELPAGRQKGVRGPAVNVPADLGPVCTILPRIPSSTHVIPLKFKRKLEYKSAYIHDSITVDKVCNALHYLKTNNDLYKDKVTFNENWIDQWKQCAPEMYESLFNDAEQEPQNNDTNEAEDIGSTKEQPHLPSASDVEVSDDAIEREDLEAYEKSCKLRGVPHTTLLQNEIFNDFGSETGTYSIAPGEGQKPLPLLTDKNCEELAFPDKYPLGRGGFNSERPVKITHRKYINARLLSCDGRFAKDINYILGMQYAIEHAYVISAMNIAMRRINPNMVPGGRVTAGLLRDSNFVNNIIRTDMAYRFLKNVRGSPPYWQTMFYEALAMIRTLGIPTFFLTLSAADLRWPEVIQAIGAQYGQRFTAQEVKEMPWREKCKWINQNPVTVARMFQHRVESFLTHFLKSNAAPIGQVTNHVIRVEFQARGSPHIHCMFWIRDAPRLGYSTDAEVIEFIDKHISCGVPEDNPDLATLVKELQVHSHSSSCRRKGHCRFHYPRPPVNRTIISKEESGEEVMTFDDAKETLASVWKVLEDSGSQLSLDEVLEAAQITMDKYEKALSTSKRGRSVILKRKMDELNINCYSPPIMSAWKANMDFQYIVDAYACLMYVASYVLKAEKGMSELLKQAAKEVERESIRTQLAKLSSVFLTNREVSVQEAVYRVNGMPLRLCSKSSHFVNTDVPERRIGLLLPSHLLQDKNEDDEDVRSKNMTDRYMARPETLEDLCLADFVASYTYQGNAAKEKKNKAVSSDVSDNESDEDAMKEVQADENGFNITALPKVIKLEGNLGNLQRRKSQAILRWPGFSVHKNAEKYYRSRLMLFTAWRDETNLAGEYNSYEERYHAEYEAIHAIECRFIHEEEKLQRACKDLEEHGNPQSAWDMLAPSTVEAEDSDKAEGSVNERPMDSDDIQANIESIIRPTDSADGRISERYTREASKDILPPSEYNRFYRSLNIEQRQIINYHRDWCKETVALLKQKKPVKPYQLFLSGPGGVGKSYVIKMIHTDTVRYLRYVPGIHATDLTCLLSATTGVAAFNIEGMTIHSAFQLYDSSAQGRSKRAASQKNQYIPLSADARNTIRTSMDNLFVVIIDEISMMSADDLYKLHMRLQELMNVGTQNTRFGNVTIIAVGDLYQLPAIGTKVYDITGRFAMDDLRRLHGSLWKETFMLHELTQVVRQKDPEFVGLLNRLRTAEITAEDERLLQTRVIKENDPNHYIDALHVYGTNKEADTYNQTMVCNLGEDIICITADDVGRDKPSGMMDKKLKDRIAGLTRRYTGNLESVLQISKRSIIKLTCNIDVGDGLCNGARGKVKDFIKAGAQVEVVLVEFEHPNVGGKAKASSPYKKSHPNAVPVYRHANSFYIREVCVSRKQFPLVLAFASTIHSVQGLTVDRIVCDMSTVRQPGQVYVGLSRVRTLEGLQILNYKKSAIKKDRTAVTEMDRLRQRKLQISKPIWLPKSGMLVAYLNVRGFLGNVQDIQMDPAIRDADIITCVESHLQPHNQINHVLPKPNMHVFRKDRVNMPKGGVVSFTDTSIQATEPDIAVGHLEATTIHVPLNNLVIVTIYRRPVSSNVTEFLRSVGDLLEKKFFENKNILVVGDFNEEHGGKVSKCFEQFGFQQMSHGPTTDYGNAIDHAYTKGNMNATIALKNTYYSDHDMLLITVST